MHPLLKPFKAIIDYILPPRCYSCREFIAGADGFCHDCWNKLNFISAPYCSVCGCTLSIPSFEDITCGKCIAEPPKYKIARSLLKFDEHSKKLMHDFKYYDQTELASFFSKLLHQRYKEEIANADLIIPVPMNKLKRLFRMYNQAHILAQALSKLTKKPVLANALVKTKWTKSQTSLSKKQRETNLRSSLKFNNKHNIKHKNIILIDDVMTTGSTIKECAKLLKYAGANNIYVVTIART